jgi:hypothetical protein
MVYQQKKGETINTPYLLQPLAIPSQHWENISMDFITSLPQFERNIVIMVVVDQLKKYAHFFSRSHPFKESTLSIAFIETVQNLHGVPKIIVSDIDTIFSRFFLTKLFSCLGTQLAHNLSYHPQSDGQIEIVNKFLEGCWLWSLIIFSIQMSCSNSVWIPFIDEGVWGGFPPHICLQGVEGGQHPRRESFGKISL